MSHRSRLVFVGISGTCLVSHNLIMIVTYWSGFALWASMVVSFVLVGLLGYCGHSLLTFGQPLSLAGLWRYLLGIGTGTAVAIPIIWFWKVGLALPMVVASPMASLCTIGVNYVLVHWALVRRAHQVKHPAQPAV
jgi:hypothetical protein